jgi:hypothetical protein
LFGESTNTGTKQQATRPKMGKADNEEEGDEECGEQSHYL